MDKQMIEEKKEIERELNKVYPNAKFTNGWIAEVFYKIGYRKIPEGAVVLTDKQDIEQYIWSKCLDESGFMKFARKLRKETAEKYAERLKESLDISVEGYSTSEVMSEIEDKIDEIAKEITEGKDDDTSEVGK